MELWFFAEIPFGFRLLLLPQSSGSFDATGETAVASKWERGPAVELAQLPWTFVLAKPVPIAENSERTEKTPEGFPAAMRIQFCTDTVERAPLAPHEDGIGLMSLFAEYVQILTVLFDALQLPIRSIAPSVSGVILEFPSCGSGGDREFAADISRLLLAAATADWLARGRGFRVRDVQCATQKDEWRELDGRWLEPVSEGWPVSPRGTNDVITTAPPTGLHAMREP